MRPIIFVAHSLGGLICAQVRNTRTSDDNITKNRQAILKALSSIEEPDRTIEESVRRVAFLSTPFLGSDLVGWAEIGRRFASLFHDTNKALFKDLEESSHQLANISEEFPKWLRKRDGRVEIVCFTEELETDVVGKVSRLPSTSMTSLTPRRL